MNKKNKEKVESTKLIDQLIEGDRMYNKVETITSGSARVDMLGTIDRDIEIKKSGNNNNYGILTVSVIRENGKVNRFTVFVWNQTVLDKLSVSLKKGICVWIVGELELVKRVSGQGEESPATFGSDTVTINIREEKGISIQKDIRIANDIDLEGLNLTPRIKAVTDNIA